MNRLSPVAVSAVLLSLSLQAPIALASEQDQLDGNIGLFSVLSAVTAASEEEPSPSDHKLRAAVRDHIRSKNPPVLAEIRRFVTEHRKKTATENIGQYVSFALAATEPPQFQPKFQATEVPPDVQELSGFEALMIRFHREAEIDDLWRKVQPHYEAEIARYHTGVSKAVLEANGYLRNATSGAAGRRFAVYFELMAPGGQVHTRSYRDEYMIVVSPAETPRIDDIRHGYLHYLLDPLIIRNAKRIEKNWPLIDYALGAPMLEERYKTDIGLLTGESLIRAVEARMARSSDQAKQALLEGFVFVPFFTEQLVAYEKQESSMNLHFPEMIAAVDLSKETRRLEGTKFFARTEPTPAQPKSAPVPPPVLSKSEQAIEAAEKLYASRELEPARQQYLSVLQITEDRPSHSRAYFGLARIAVLQKNPELAEQLFKKSLDLSPDPYTLSWSQVFLARLYENSSTPETALEHYRAALAVEGAPPGARKAAEEGVQKFAKKK